MGTEIRELVSKIVGGRMFACFYRSRQNKSAGQIATEGQWTAAKRSLRE